MRGMHKDVFKSLTEVNFSIFLISKDFIFKMSKYSLQYTKCKRKTFIQDRYNKIKNKKKYLNYSIILFYMQYL